MHLTKELLPPRSISDAICQLPLVPAYEQHSLQQTLDPLTLIPYLHYVTLMLAIHNTPVIHQHLYYHLCQPMILPLMEIVLYQHAWV